MLQMMLTSGKTYSKASLAEEISKTFGPEARFYTCSAEDLTAGQLVEFLEARGKFIPQGEGIQTSAHLICRH